MPPTVIRPPRVVLRPSTGPDQIADVWIEGKVENYLDTPYGKFSLLRTGQRYVIQGSRSQMNDQPNPTRARIAVDLLRDAARAHGMTHFVRDPAVMAIHAVIDAYEKLVASQK